MDVIVGEEVGVLWRCCWSWAIWKVEFEPIRERDFAPKWAFKYMGLLSMLAKKKW